MGRKIVGVIGAGRNISDQLRATAEEVGRLVAEKGWLLVCGGRGGVMEAAARGAKLAGGTTIGILPGADTADANEWIDIPVATGFGEGRNLVIIRTADVVIAVGGEYGTLSEIGFSLKLAKPVVALQSWDIQGVYPFASPQEAVEEIERILRTGEEICVPN